MKANTETDLLRETNIQKLEEIKQLPLDKYAALVLKAIELQTKLMGVETDTNEPADAVDYSKLSDKTLKEIIDASQQS